MILGAFRLLFVGILLLVAGNSGSANAQSLFERLVLPGDLVEAHAKLQKECSNCHTSFSKGAQVELCLDCHKKVRDDVESERGFHGKSPEVDARHCNHCHTDHIGRDANIVIFDHETFDHKMTDFALTGAHEGVGCTGCHEQGKKFREAKSACIDCHKKDEPHKGALGKDCQQCHQTTAWSDTKAFDHSKTKFRLDGKHKNVACQSCHAGEVYKGLPTTCVGCHSIQDVHAGRFGDKCETCHAPEKWTEVRFNHDKDTKFALIGKHRDAKCSACHKSNAYTENLGTNCVDCHRSDDPHSGKLGDRCETCHDSRDWLQEVRFDHDITRFPLIGLHVLVPCEECHVDQTFRGTPLGCIGCHRQDDFHEGRMGAVCETCHNPNGWEFWIFDHGKQTKFRLTGKHDGLRCRACHTPARGTNLKISTTCVSCHAKDDVHRGQFGRNCEVCHGTGTFKNARLR